MGERFVLETKYNPEFTPGMKDIRFHNWVQQGVSKLQDLLEGRIVMSFTQLTEKYNIPRRDFYQYLQVRDFIRRDTANLVLQDISDIETNFCIQMCLLN